MANSVRTPEEWQSVSSREFVERLREVKDRSGFAYRELERRAAENGDVLPHSTLASALKRESLPRREVVESFVRACGRDPEEVDAWVRERDRLARGEQYPQGSAEPRGHGGAVESVAPDRQRRVVGWRGSLVGVVIGTAVTSFGWWLASDVPDSAVPDSAPSRCEASFPAS
ncbi:helix-turn-helix domain-containing protein [Streptomyces sp. NPDC059009]|uniref:helix-turn-helix domain-containing protein n=1 Tax=Streptomyces sp. NPDC059009 TaxID=3346694 RepID=UPI0036BBD83D